MKKFSHLLLVTFFAFSTSLIVADVPVYKVGSEISFQPYEFKDENGLSVGFEIDLLNAIAKKQGFKVIFFDESRKLMEETLNNNKYDIWASALSITPDRLMRVDMTEPFLNTQRAIMILDNEQNASLQTINDFYGHTIITNRNTSKSSIDHAIKITGDKSKVLTSATSFLAMKAMYQGKVDGVMSGKRSMQYFSKKYPQFKVRFIDLDEQKTGIGFAVKKGNQALLEQLNEGLSQIKIDGTYDTLIEKWFTK